MMKIRITILLILSMVFLQSASTFAQGDLAAILEVVDEGVEVKRVNTDQWLAIRAEAIVGVGDSIRTSETGRARITFFSDGVETTVEPATEIIIEAFNGDAEPDGSFTLSVRVVAGQTLQRLDRALDEDSDYNVETPGASLVARGTNFAVRVEPSGRSGMLVFDGVVGAENDSSAADVPAQFGIRAAVGDAISDVVRADTFAQLDAALDGCSVIVTTPDDVRLNARLGPSLDFPAVGTIDADAITNVKGVTESGGWYRIDFRGGFAWVLSSTASIQGECAGLRQFPDDAPAEDPMLYEFVGDPVELDDLLTPEADPESE